MTINMEVLRQEIADDEGCKYEIYLDHLHLPTFGIGHLIKETDPEHGKPVGTVIEQERVHRAFELDMLVCLEDCRRLYPGFDDLPQEVCHILSNMAFNLGYPRLSKFLDLKKAVEEKDWNACADAMVDSRWYTQVPNRARRLVTRMRAVGNEEKESDS